MHSFERNAFKSEPVEGNGVLDAAMDEFERLFDNSTIAAYPEKCSGKVLYRLLNDRWRARPTGLERVLRARRLL